MPSNIFDSVSGSGAGVGYIPSGEMHPIIPTPMPRVIIDDIATTTSYTDIVDAISDAYPAYPLPIPPPPAPVPISNPVQPNTAMDLIRKEIERYKAILMAIQKEIDLLRMQAEDPNLSQISRTDLYQQIQFDMNALTEAQSQYARLQNDLMNAMEEEKRISDPCAVPIGAKAPPVPNSFEEVLSVIKNYPEFRPCVQKLVNDWLARLAPTMSQDMMTFFKMLPLELTAQIYWWQGREYTRMTSGGGAG